MTARRVLTVVVTSAALFCGCGAGGALGSDAAVGGGDASASDGGPGPDVAASGGDAADAPGDAAPPLPEVAPTCTPSASQYNAAKQVELARARPPWVEMSISVGFRDPGFDWPRLGMAGDAEREQLIQQRMADLAPIQDDLEARLRAVGGRRIVRFWLSASISATVPAGAVPLLPCWPEVTDVTGDGLATDIRDSCLTTIACDGACAKASGDLLDLANGCAHHDAAFLCFNPLIEADGPLTCYVDPTTGVVFTVKSAFLVELGAAALRACTPTEGGPTAPALLPECP